MPQGALTRRGMALLLPVLATITAAAVPAGMDVYKLQQREPALSALQLGHAALYALGLNSLAGLLLGLGLGLLLAVLTRGRDLSETWHRVTAGPWGYLARRQRDPGAAAALYAGALGLAAWIGGGYLLTYHFFTRFHNHGLAALALAGLAPLLLLAAVLVALTCRVGIAHLTAACARVPGLSLLATVTAALLLPLLAIAAAATYLVLAYLPIVRIVEWRALSYPGLSALAILGVLWAALAVRHRRLALLEPASALRRVGLGAWCAVFLALWGYTLQTLGDQALLRTALLRRGWGSAYAFDLLSVVLDFDRDGYLSFFGGGDCAPFNGLIHPGAIEIPGNGVDDNCFGGDLSSRNLTRPSRRFDHALPAELSRKELSFVFITLDGLRADRVGAYGYSKPTTPNIDKLAARSVVFERAYTQAPSTRYSIPSFLTSKYSSQVPRKSVLTIPRPVLPDALTLAEVLQTAGYKTGAALSYMVFERSWGMDQGFDFYDLSQAPYYNGKGTPGWDAKQPYVLIDAARRFLSTVGDRRFFLWVHLFEPHPPYADRRTPVDFGPGEDGQYDGELRFADGKVAELLEALRRHRQADRTVIVLSADHGRGLGDHGTARHGYDLFGENLHVPMIWSLPGIRPRRIKHPVALLDVMPTLVNLARIDEEFDFEGRSLVPQLVEGIEPDPGRPIFAEVQVGFQNSEVINAITTRDYKLIYDVSLNTYQLFDLRSDPHEKTNLADKQPAALKRMQEKLNAIMERATLPHIQEQVQASLVKAAPPTPGAKQVNFDNKILFLGFEVEPARPSAGGVVFINWYVKALTKLDQDYKFVVRLEGKKKAFFDAKHVPVDGLYPFSRWKAGQLVRDRQHMRLPPVPQEYDVWVGFGLGHDYLEPVQPLEMIHTCVKVGTLTTY